MIRAVIFDIEGTIGDIAFVRSVLFPFARERIEPYLARHWSDPQVVAIVEAAREASTQALPTPQQASAQFAAWSDEDRKITPLKTLQGLIWRSGYEAGVLKAHLYDDAVAAMQRFHAQGLRLYIYSSGSVEAQRLYMAHSVAGDLRSLISSYFDTTTGPKSDAASYAAIARHTGDRTGDMMFFSDARAEVAAALAAGMNAMLLCRDPVGGAETVPAEMKPISSFEPIDRL